MANGVPITGSSDQYTIDASFSSEDTAFFVIDPWNDFPSDFLNEYYGEITNKYVLPLIERANHHNFPIFIFTNNCKDLSHFCSIPKQFIDLSNSKNVKIIYWQDISNTKDFIENLQKMGIKKIIYTGFASNCCILYRPTGIIEMQKQGFLVYFIPKASAAVEITETWQSGELHKFSSIMIAQVLGSLIEYDDIFPKLDSN